MKERLEAELKDWQTKLEDAQMAHGLALLQQAPAYQLAQAIELVAERERHLRDAEVKLKALKLYKEVQRAEERRQEQSRQHAAAERKEQLKELAKPCESGATAEDTFSRAKRRFENDYPQLRRPDAKEVMAKRAEELIPFAKATGYGAALDDLKKFFRGFGGSPELHNIVPNR